MLLLLRRKYEDENGCRKAVWFHIVTQEKGDKTTTNVEALLLLDESNEKVSKIVQDANVAQRDGKPSETVRAWLGDVTTSSFREKFRLHFWGDISFLAFLAVAQHDVCPACVVDLCCCSSLQRFPRQRCSVDFEATQNHDDTGALCAELWQAIQVQRPGCIAFTAFALL